MSKSILNLLNGTEVDTEGGDYICKLFFLIFSFFKKTLTFFFK